MRRVATPLAILAVYLAACRIMLAPICNFAQLETAHYGGDTRLVIWTLAWDNHALLDRVPSLFDANIFYPARNTLAYTEHLYGISLFTLPIYAATRNPVLAYNIVWILSFLLCAVSAHLLAWRHTRDHVASLMAGLIFAFCFYRMHQGHGHLHMIWSFWIPLSFIALERWFATPTWPRLAGLVSVFLLQALASGYQAVMILVADLLLAIWLMLVERPGARLRRLALQAVVGGIAIATGVAWFASHYSVIGREGPAAVAAGGADLAGYLVPPENTFVGQWMLAHLIKGPRFIWGELTIFLGWLTLGMAGIGAVLVIRRRDEGARRLTFFVVLACVAIALAAGPSASEVAANSWGWSPFGLLMRVPVVNLFRVPARFTELLTLALAILAAAACATLHQRHRRIGRVLTVAIIPLVLGEFYVVNFPGGAPKPFPVPEIYKFVAMLPPGALVSLPDFADTPNFLEEVDYQFFSTAHWHPIVNGWGRWGPPGFRALMDRLQTFPSASSAATMRATRISFVALHAARLGDGKASLVAEARASRHFRLLARFGDDYLFEVLGDGAR